MGQKRILSPETPVRSFPTPNIEDLVVIQDVDSRLPGYKPLDYGTPHPDQTRFKGAKLVYQEPLENSDTFVRRIYATDRLDQDAYNYAVKYSAGSPDHPIYIRTYVAPRADYFPLPEGTADPFLENAFLVEEEMAPVEGELNSLYVRVSRVYETLPGPVLTSFETNDVGQKVTVTTQRKSSAGYNLPAASATSSPSAQAEDTGVVTEQIRSVPAVFARPQFSAERPDPLPTKFRAAVPDVETSSIVVGTAQQPTLSVPQDLSASEAQETQFLKRVSRRLRPDPSYPVTFVETTRVNTGQIAMVTSVLEDFLQSADSGPLIESSEVTDLGDGRSIKVTTEVDQVFEQPSFTRAKEDLTPPKFRAVVSETTEERTVAGVASMPAVLAANEFSKTEEQLTVDRKRVRTQERAITETDTLVEQVITPEGQLATRTLTLSDQEQSVSPSATLIQGEVEQLGDGRTVKTEVVVPAVFGRESFAQERPDVIPVEFRDQIPTTTTEITEEGQASAVSLTGDEIAKTQEQVTADTRRTRVVTRSNSLTTDSLTGRAFNTEWGVPELVVDSIVDPTTQPDPSGLVLQDQITPLNSTRSRRVRRELQAVPANYFYYEVAQDQVVIKNEVSLHRRDVTDPADPTFLPVPVVVGAIADITDTPLEFPWVRRVTKRLPTNSVGDIILPEARVEYDTITYTFPGIIYTWKARYTGDQVRANLSFFDNRYPVSMTVAARYEVTYHVLDAGDPDDDPDLNLSNPAARNNFEFFRVITRPWARIFFNIPDNTIHPPAPITLAKESVDRGGVAFDIQGGQSSEPVAYTPGDLILVGGEVKKYWGNIYTKRLVYVREPV
jgi:hypothetical protein